jgi:hypothetical protein
MKIVFAGVRRYYGQDDSYDYLVLAGSLTDMGHTVTYVPTDAPNLNQRLERICADIQPDCIIYLPSDGEMDMKQFAALPFLKILLLADDDWRRDYGKQLAPYADVVLANAADSADVYGKKFIPFQWGIRKSLYSGFDEPRTINVSFFGLNYGTRAQIMGCLAHAGIPPTVYGRGWPHEIRGVDIPLCIAQSRISLNTSMSSKGNRRQIKGRVFEIPAGGALMLTENAPELERYYEPGVECVVWETPDELVSKVLYYLTHEDERQQIANAGKARTFAEHTYHCRFARIFEDIGLEEGQR